MKKLTIVIIFVIMILTLAACNGGYEKAVLKDGSEEQVTIYQEVGPIVIVVTDRAVHITSKDDLDKE